MNKDFKLGYDAAALGEPNDKTKSKLWQEGWQQYHDDQTRSETQKFA